MRPAPRDNATRRTRDTSAVRTPRPNPEPASTDLDALGDFEATSPGLDGLGADDAAEWLVITSKLGLTLPAGYRRLVARFGRGPFANFLHVLSPFTSNEFLNLERALQSYLGALRAIRLQDPDSLPFPVRPEPGGLLPWAITDNGDVLCWLTKGTPESWATVIVALRGPRHEILEMSAERIVRAFVSATLPSAILPRLGTRA